MVVNSLARPPSEVGLLRGTARHGGDCSLPLPTHATKRFEPRSFTGASATRRCGMHPAHRKLLANPTKILPRGIEGKVQGTHLGQCVEPIVLVINGNDVPAGLAEAA